MQIEPTLSNLHAGTHVGTNKTPSRRDAALSQDQGLGLSQRLTPMRDGIQRARRRFREERTEIPFEGTLGTRVLFCFDRHCCLPTLTEGGSDQQSADSVDRFFERARDRSRVAPIRKGRSVPIRLESWVGCSHHLSRSAYSAFLECQLPKLDVAGSIPVSRSILSITYGRLPNMCSVCAPFIIYAPLNYWKCIANCHIECSVRRSSAAIPVDPVYQALTRRCSAHDRQLGSEHWDDPTRANLRHDRAERPRPCAGEPTLHLSQRL